MTCRSFPTTTTRSMAFSNSRTFPGQVVLLHRLQGLRVNGIAALFGLSGVASQKVLRQQRDIFRPLPQGWHLEMDDVQAVKKVLAEGFFQNGFLEVLVGGGNDPKVAVQGRIPPTRVNSWVSRTRRRSICIFREISPTSSRKRVPALAISSRPFLVYLASVKAPFSCPKSSLSRRCSVKAPQLMAIKGA